MRGLKNGKEKSLEAIKCSVHSKDVNTGVKQLSIVVNVTMRFNAGEGCLMSFLDS